MRKVVTGDKNLQLIQDNVAAALQGQSTTIALSTDAQGNPVIKRSKLVDPFSGGNLVVTALVSGKDNVIPHGLGRLPRIWIIGRIDTNASVWEVKTTLLPDKLGNSQSATTSYLNLQCSANCNVAVWVN